MHRQELNNHITSHNLSLFSMLYNRLITNDTQCKKPTEFPAAEVRNPPSSQLQILDKSHDIWNLYFNLNFLKNFCKCYDIATFNYMKVVWELMYDPIHYICNSLVAMYTQTYADNNSVTLNQFYGDIDSLDTRIKWNIRNLTFHKLTNYLGLSLDEQFKPMLQVNLRFLDELTGPRVLLFLSCLCDMNSLW